MWRASRAQCSCFAWSSSTLGWASTGADSQRFLVAWCYMCDPNAGIRRALAWSETDRHSLRVALNKSHLLNSGGLAGWSQQSERGTSRLRCFGLWGKSRGNRRFWLPPIHLEAYLLWSKGQKWWPARRRKKCNLKWWRWSNFFCSKFRVNPRCGANLLHSAANRVSMLDSRCMCWRGSQVNSVRV